jgi:hypothetical protein
MTGISSNGPVIPTPALLTTTSILPAINYFGYSILNRKESLTSKQSGKQNLK